ncbi:MFS transporter [Kineosporia succinea]|uniref:MHS family metabolite:H+ symporter-like MFS transporter n=1 Tax=Kineosporia succinea TaxID=84632 RepID=A0ABT9P8Y5_9ACTN|nr:MFS transporter [Kineosporia succinea]MDP9829148.1 MHS family metabolite:H+ symporter-like MFS transporter [Kineosporia succinea]
MSTEASAVNDTSPPDPNTRSTKDLSKAAVSGWLGTAMEFMDFQLYSLAAAIVFNEIFFPDVSPAIGLLAAMATYGVGYVARLAGAVYFGRMGDRLGRKKVLFITIAMMGVSTTLIGALPTYAQIGLFAPALLVVLRLVQGFGAGAEIAGASVMLVEYAPKGRRGLISSLIALGTNSGTLVATGIWALLLAVLSDEQLHTWGWRIPFLASFVLLVLALWIRRNVKESPVFEARDDVVDGVALDREAVKESKLEAGLKANKGKAFFMALGLRIGQAGNSGLVQTFLVGYIGTTLGLDKSVATDSLLVGSVIGFATVPFVGLLSDRFGRRAMYMTMSTLSIVLAFPMLLLVTGGSTPGLVIGMILGYNVAVVGLFALENVTMSELLGGRNRFTQVGLAKELGGIATVAAGPVIAAGLTAWANSWWPIAVMLMLYSLIALVTAYLMPEVADRDLSALEDAA